MSEHDTISEGELVDLFRPRRVDPEAFRAGIEERLAKKREEGEEGDAEVRTVEAPGFLRRVAAWLPGDPLTGAAAGSAMGKWASVKLLPAALAAPAILLGSAFAAFFAGLHSLGHSARQALPAGAHRRRSRGRPQPHWVLHLIQLVAPLVLFVPSFLGTTKVLDALLVLLVASMVGLVLSARGLARAGALTRESIGDLGTGILAALLGGAFIWGQTVLVQSDVSVVLGLGGSFALMAIGVVGCRVLGRGWTLEGGPWLATVPMFLVVAVLALTLTNPLGRLRISPPELREQLAGMDLDCTKLTAWEEAGALYQAMELTGIEPPDLGPVRRQIERALADPELDVHPTVWSTAALLHLLDVEDYRCLATLPDEARSLRILERAFGAADARVQRFNSWDRYMIPLIEVALPLDARRRARLVRWVEDCWPEAGRHDPLTRAALVVWMLDALGESARVEALRPAALELLRENWMPPAKADWLSRAGGFTSDPRKFHTSFAETTWNGVWLMARYGVPPEIDLEELRGYLTRESRADATFSDREDYLKAHQRAALVVLNARFPRPKRHLLERLLDARLFLTTILVVAMSWIAIASVPRQGVQRGAVP